MIILLHGKSLTSNYILESIYILIFIITDEALAMYQNNHLFQKLVVIAAIIQRDMSLKSNIQDGGW